MLLFLNKQIGRVSWNIHTDIYVRLCCIKLDNSKTDGRYSAWNADVIKAMNWLNALFLVGQSNKGLPQSESEEHFSRELESKSALGSKKTFSMASKEVWNIGLLD